MTARARLAVCNHGVVRHGSCAVCTRPYESVASGVLLWDGLLPRGYVCLFCLEAGPGRAAEALRARAALARAVAGRAQPRWTAGEGAAIRRRSRRCAADLDGLAARLPCPADWLPAGA